MDFFKISSATGEGLEILLDYVSKLIKTLPKEEIVEKEEKIVYTLEDGEGEFTVTKEKDKYIVTGEIVERVIRRVNIEDNESLYYLHKKLRELGVEEELKKQGIKKGDIVRIANYELEWYE